MPARSSRHCGYKGSPELGAVTAEFAVSLPAVVAIVGVLAAICAGQVERVGLASLAGTAARATAIGEPMPISDGVRFERVAAADAWVCVKAERDLRILGFVKALTLAEKGCSKELGT
jgi:hypothetical protein